MSTENPSTVAAVPGLGLRFVARLIDSILLAVLLTIAGLGMGYGFDWLLIGAAATWAYFALFLASAGATPGKRLTGLRVVGPSGGLPTTQEAFIREAFNLLGAVPFIGGLLALAAWIWILVTIQSSPTGQGKHDDLAGGTRVVRATAT